MEKVFKKRSGGFTLIEIIIVISIMAIIGGGGIAAFVSYGKSQTMSATASELINKLNLAKSRAFSQVKPSSCGSSTLEGYEFGLCDNIIFPSNHCQTTDPAVPNYEVVVKCGGFYYAVGTTGKLPAGYAFASESQPTIFFPVISGGVTTEGSITITDNNNNLSKTITVEKNGSVKINTQY